MTEHIAEKTQNVIDMARQVAAAVERVKDDNLASHISLAREEEMQRARDALHASWVALNRLRVIADRSPQKPAIK